MHASSLLPLLGKVLDSPPLFLQAYLLTDYAKKALS